MGTLEKKDTLTLLGVSAQNGLWGGLGLAFREGSGGRLGIPLVAYFGG